MRSAVMETKTRVFIIEDHVSIRELLVKVLQDQLGMEVVGESGDGQEAYQLALQLSPDLVILDIMLPGLNGVELLERLVRHVSKCRFVVFSGYNNDELLKAVMSAGAHGFVEKSAPLNVLMEAVQSVANGGCYFGPHSTRILNQAIHQKTRSRFAGRLTGRERETLQLIAEGLTTKAIAEKLSISVKTAENHRTNLMRKLDLHNAAALTRYAMEIGLVENTAFRVE